MGITDGPSRKPILTIRAKFRDSVAVGTVTILLPSGRFNPYPSSSRRSAWGESKLPRLRPVSIRKQQSLIVGLMFSIHISRATAKRSKSGMLTKCLSTVAATFAMVASAYAGHCGGGDDACASHCTTAASCMPASCAPSYCSVEKTVMVPEWGYETRTVTTTEYQKEARTRTYTVCKQVPVTTQKEVKYTVHEKEWKTKEETYYVSEPVWSEKEVEYTVHETVQEEKTGTKKVCKQVWEDKEVSYTVYEQVSEEKTGTKKVCKPVTKQKEVSYTVYETVQEEKTGTKKVCNTVAEQKEVSYQVCVPYTETMTGSRTVSKCVPVQTMKEVCVQGGHYETVCKPVAPACGGCNTGCN